MNFKFWNRKRVLITGFEGFLGSNLTKCLANSGARVVGIDLRTRRKDTLLEKSDYRKIKVYQGSVADTLLIRNIFKKHEFEVIFHLAAEAIVGESHKNPTGTFESNIKGTWTILEAARQHSGIESIIVASSDKAYGSHKVLPYTESAPLIGDHPYDVSKSCADLIAYTYFHTYGLPVAVTRCGNIYGPGDFNFSRLVPDAIRSILTGKTFLIRSNGKFTRDYIFVDDIVDGYILLAEKLKSRKLAGEAFNFSNENPLSVLDFLKQIYRIAGRKPDYKILNEAQFEIKHQYLSSRKAAKVLRWKSRLDIEQGLAQTISWYRNYMES